MQGARNEVRTATATTLTKKTKIVLHGVPRENVTNIRRINVHIVMTRVYVWQQLKGIDKR